MPPRNTMRSFLVVLIFSLSALAGSPGQGEEGGGSAIGTMEYDWSREILSTWDYQINKSVYGHNDHPVPIGKPKSISLSLSGDFVVSVHEIGCVSLIWTDGSMEMQVYCHTWVVGSTQYINIGHVAISPDESFLAMCTQPYNRSSGEIIEKWAQIHTVSVLNYSTNPRGATGGDSWSTISGSNLIDEYGEQRYNYSECDSIGFHNVTGNLVGLFDKHETNESQGSIEFHEHDLCCSCCDFPVIFNETTGEMIGRTANQSGFDMTQIDNVTWPKVHENEIWLDGESLVLENIPSGNHDSILQNNPDIMEMMLNGGLIYYNGDSGLSKFTIITVDSDNDSNEGISDLILIFLFLILLIGIIGNEPAAKEAKTKEAEEAKTKEAEQKLLAWKEERKRKVKMAETRKKNRVRLESRKTKLREIADGVFASIEDFEVDLDDGTLEFSVKGRRLIYEKSLTRTYKSIEDEMVIDSKKAVKRTSNKVLCDKLGCFSPALGNRAKVAWGGWFREDPRFCAKHQPEFVE